MEKLKIKDLLSYNPFDNKMGWEHIVSRGNEIRTIRNQFQAMNGEPIILSGPAGIGKTTLCYQYIKQYSHEYDFVLLLPLRRFYSQEELKSYIISETHSDKVKTHFSKIDFSQNNNSIERYPYSIVEIFQEAFKKVKTLLVIDDIDLITINSYKDFSIDELIHFNKKNKNCDIIISGRYCSTDKNLTALTLSGFNLEQSLSLLYKALDTTNSFTNHYVEKLAVVRDKLLNRLDGNPLLLSLAFELFKKTENIDTIINELDKIFNLDYNTLLLNFDKGILKPSLLNIGEINNIIYPNRQIVSTTPYIVIPRVNFYWRKALEDFEQLINSNDIKEQQIQNFFINNPDFLSRLDYKKVVSQPTLEHDGEKDMKPDFLLCPHNTDLCDIMELKLPTHRLVSGKNNRIKLSSVVENAIAQVRHYRDYFDSKENKERFLKKYGLTAYKPKVSILIGKTPEFIPEEKMVDLKTHALRDNIEIITFDNFFEKMKRFVYKN